jgi:hypothetical protein
MNPWPLPRIQLVFLFRNLDDDDNDSRINFRLHHSIRQWSYEKEMDTQNRHSTYLQQAYIRFSQIYIIPRQCRFSVKCWICARRCTSSTACVVGCGVRLISSKARIRKGILCFPIQSWSGSSRTHTCSQIG